MPGTDWTRLGADGSRRQDQRTQFVTGTGTLILMRYDVALIRGDEQFTAALASGRETTFADQYMYMTPQFDVAAASYGWLTESLFIGRGRLAGPKRIEYQLYRVGYLASGPAAQAPAGGCGQPVSIDRTAQAADGPLAAEVARHRPG